MNLIREVIKHSLTGIDGETYDIGRVSWVLTTAIIIIVQVGYMITHPSATLDILNFGTAISANVAAHGAAVGLKSKTEPV